MNYTTCKNKSAFSRHLLAKYCASIWNSVESTTTQPSRLCLLVDIYVISWGVGTKLCVFPLSVILYISYRSGIQKHFLKKTRRTPYAKRSVPYREHIRHRAGRKLLCLNYGINIFSASTGRIQLNNNFIQMLTCGRIRIILRFIDLLPFFWWIIWQYIV